MKASKTKQQRTNSKIGLQSVIDIILVSRGRFSLFVGDRFTWDSIFTLNPPAEVDELAALRTEGAKGVVFPFDWFTAGWTLHET